MKNFVFSIPTIAYFGKGQIKVLGETIKAHGGSKVLLAYGGGSIKTNGIYEAIIEQFQRAGLTHAELSGIKPNPRVESVDEGIRLYQENRCDFILAVGGGSALDASKAIAAGVMYDGPVTDLFVDESGVSPIIAAAPLATILTMAAHFGMPVSTTHSISTAIMGVGFAKNPRSLKLGVIERILWAWVLTIPASALCAWIILKGMAALGLA